MEKVSVNRSVLIGVIAVAGVSLLALAFVLGRESGSGTVSAPPTRIERIAPRTREGAPAPPTPAQGAEEQAAASLAPAPAGGGQGSAGFDAERASVAAYFDTIEHIQAGAVSGEAEGVAGEMATALANGDTSGLDRMIRDTEAAKASLAAVTPPASCAAHHRESLASLDDAMEVLRSLKAAMESSEPVARLAAVSTRATALRSRADALQKEELALRERYGLKR